MTKTHLPFLTASLLALSACATPPKERTLQLESYTLVDQDTVNTQANIYHQHVRGGAGTLFAKGRQTFNYISGVVDAPLDEDFSLTLLGHTLDKLDTPRRNTASTLQAAINLNTRWSIGAGLLHFSGADNDVGFGRLLYMHKTPDLEIIVGGFIKESAGDVQPGFSSIGGPTNLYGFQPVLGMQREKEQARYTAGVIFPALSSLHQQNNNATNTLNIQPAFDILYVDNTVGDNPGPQFTLGNFTLGYNGKFFSLKGKTGRLLGATGIWSPNPVIGTDSSVVHNLNFNRIIDPAAMGNFFNVQYIGFKKPTGESAAHLDALLFPTQFDGAHSPLDRVFFGVSHDTFGDKPRTGPLLGATFDVLGFSGNFSISTYRDDVTGLISASVNF